MGITRDLDAHDLTSDDFYIAEPESRDHFGIVKRPRIGVDYAGDWAHELLRFYIEGNAYISKP
jgi:DNA-3-methyladenine glycosylase